MPSRTNDLPVLSNEQARALALRAQGIGQRSVSPPIDVLRRLGVIQLDSVNVIARPQELVPFARIGPYRTVDMHRAIYQERGGFEYWGHEASWLPIDEFRYFLHRMGKRRGEPRGWWSEVRTKNAELYPLVLERIRGEGPLGSAAFADPRSVRGTWWDWKPAKLVLEDLFDRGELMCTNRSAGFARIYDLPERVLPGGLDLTDPGPAEASRHLMRRAIVARGVANGPEAADYYRLKPGAWRPALAELLEGGDIEEVVIEGPASISYVARGALNGDLSIPEHRPTLLSPFDNLLWHRVRVERLFGFRYRVEIYVPEAKRQYGYYVLPLLVRGGLHGRIDLKLDRKLSILRARTVWLEGATLAEAEVALRDMANHLGAIDFTIERIVEDSRPA